MQPQSDSALGRLLSENLYNEIDEIKFRSCRQVLQTSEIIYVKLFLNSAPSQS